MITVKLILITAYVGCVVAANALTARYGLVPVGFGLVATAGTYAAGLALLARDAVDDAAGRRGVLAAIAVGGALSWVLSTPTLAIASTAAFLLSESADWLVYAPLRRRGWARAAAASGIAGSVVDTFAFLGLAGFGYAAPIVAGQLVGKALWATVVPVAVIAAARWVVKRRAVPRYAVNAEGA